MSTSPRRLATLLFSTALAAGLTLAAAPAHAASATVGAPNGMAGLAETVWVNAPASANTTVPVSFALDGVTSGTLNIPVNARGAGTVSWTPSSAGTWTLSAAGATSTLIVAPMPTTTTLAIPNSVGLNVPQNLVVTVNALGGSVAPSGTVAIKSIYGGMVGTAPLNANAGTASSSATIAWTPTAPYANPLYATYTPAPSSGLAASSAPTWPVYVDFPQPVVSLRMPANLTVGKPAVLTAVLNGVSTTGGVAFLHSINGTTVTIGSATVTGAETSITWTPTVPGQQILSVEFTGTAMTSGITPTGVSTQATVVAAAAPIDVISVNPNGAGVLVAGQRATIRNGAPLKLIASAQSGSTVTFNAAGPCAISSNVLFATANKGTCTLTAYSPGNASYSPATSTITLTVLAKAKK